MGRWRWKNLIYNWVAYLTVGQGLPPPTFLDVSELQHVEHVSRQMGWSESQSPLVGDWHFLGCLF